MSFEGYNQILCENGHLFTYDVYDPENPTDLQDWECPICKAKLGWWNTVDQTNGNDPETGKCPGELDFEQIRDPVTEMCQQCGHVDTIAPARYKIPDK